MKTLEVQNPTKNGEKEKKAVALWSVLAAIFLTVIKLGMGIWTGSLGILAEAAHSGLDLVAALVTYLAVRVSDKPPDEGHPYGHGKVENLSALVETLLLLITCVWIIYEAASRLFFRSVHVEVNVWAFAVMAISIIVDFNRSRALRRAAIKHDSQALEADALHFSTDIWSSAVVIAGLALVKVNEWLGGPSFLAKADALAALGVALIVIYVSWKLGKSAVDVLLDTAPKGLTEKIEGEVLSIEGVANCRRVRIRRSGPRSFVDLSLDIQGDASFERAHEITYKVEQMVRRLIPRADVLVHYEPSESEDTLPHGPAPGLAYRIRSLAKEMGAEAHSIWAREIGGRYHVELHLEVDREASLESAHDLASRLEYRVKEATPDVSGVVAHIEPMGDVRTLIAPLHDTHRADVEEKMVALIDALVAEGACHRVTIWEEEDGLAASLHCSVSPEVSVERAHDLSEELETRLREEIPQLRRVVIHLEPPV